jgi:hypothetical protein
MKKVFLVFFLFLLTTAIFADGIEGLLRGSQFVELSAKEKFEAVRGILSGWGLVISAIMQVEDLQCGQTAALIRLFGLSCTVKEAVAQLEEYYKQSLDHLEEYVGVSLLKIYGRIK